MKQTRGILKNLRDDLVQTLRGLLKELAIFVLAPAAAALLVGLLATNLTIAVIAAIVVGFAGFLVWTIYSGLIFELFL